MLDYVGKMTLIWKHGDSISSREILQFKFAETIKTLYELDIIGESIQRKMAKVYEVRNRLGHDLLFQYPASAKIDIRIQQAFEKMINESIEIIRMLLSVQA